MFNGITIRLAVLIPAILFWQMNNFRASAAVTSDSLSANCRRTPAFMYLVFSLLAGHMMISMAILVVPAVAPLVARDFGIDPSLIGYQSSFVSAGLLTSLLFMGNMGRRFGACRTNQLGLGLSSSGMLLMLFPYALLLISGSYMMGIGYGLMAPTASTLLMRFSSAERRNFVFSFQQTGVPLGGMLAALLAPIIAVLLGWRWAVIFSALLLFCVLLLMQRGRKYWDDDRNSAAPAISSNPFSNFIMVWRNRHMRLIALMGGLFCWGQVVVASYTVVAAVTLFHMSLVVAGILLTVVQLGNVVGRIIVGLLADRIGSSTRVLIWSAGMMIVTSVASLWMDPSWPMVWLCVLFALYGITTGTWGGLMLADIGRLAPPGYVGAAISGALVFVNSGKFLGPIVFANVYAVTKNYQIAFASLAVPAVMALYCLLQTEKMSIDKPPL